MSRTLVRVYEAENPSASRFSVAAELEMDPKVVEAVNRALCAAGAPVRFWCLKGTK